MIKEPELLNSIAFHYLITFFIVSTRVHQVHLVFRELLELLDLLYVSTTHPESFHLLLLSF